MDKPATSSVTLWGGAVVTGIEVAEQSGLIPVGTAATILSLVQAIAGFVALYGLRRAVKPSA